MGEAGPDGPEEIPPQRRTREALRRRIRAHVVAEQPVPPLNFAELRQHAVALLDEGERAWRDYAALLLNNELWADRLAAVPPSRRLLVLPTCRHGGKGCPHRRDARISPCQCCALEDLHTAAEAENVQVLTTDRTQQLQTAVRSGRVEGIVGVGSLDDLRRVYPLLEAMAVPAAAMPLLPQDGDGSGIDLDWVWDLVVRSHQRTRLKLDLDRLRREVGGWFTPAGLARIMGEPHTETERVSQEWLAQAGKRWRPFLAAAVAQAVSSEPKLYQRQDLHAIAVGVECFHKASLVHDDIEDEDDVRYGEPTVHARYGVPAALNVGDHILGEGYRLIAESQAPPHRRAAMLRVAAEGHRTLCIGQGEELFWHRHPRPLETGEVLEIFRRKTAPAFAVALHVGALYSGASEHVCSVLERYSEALGIAYQIKDDLDDYCGSIDSHDVEAMRPSFILALARQRATGDNRRLLDSLWRREVDYPLVAEQVSALIRDLGVTDAARAGLERHKEVALNVLGELSDSTLKALLRRVIGKIFDEVELQGVVGSTPEPVQSA